MKYQTISSAPTEPLGEALALAEARSEMRSIQQGLAMSENYARNLGVSNARSAAMYSRAFCAVRGLEK